MTSLGTVEGNVIDMDTWWHKLTDAQRDELGTVKDSLTPQGGITEFEYVDIGGSPTLRLTWIVRDDKRRSLIDPSCTCGPGGRRIHLWMLTLDYPLTESLPAWWKTEAS